MAVIGWIIFRAENMQQAYDFLSRMFLTMFDDYNIKYGKVLLLYGLGLLIVEWLQRDKQHALQFSNIKPFNYRWIRWMIYYILLVIIAQNVGNEQTFIYFQF